MKKIFIILSSIVIFLLLVRYFRGATEREVLNKIEEAVKNNDSIISFVDVNSNYDSLILVRCYTNTEMLKEEIGVNLKHTFIDERDDYHLIVLLKNRTIKEIVYLKNFKYSVEADASRIFPRSHQFKIKKVLGSPVISE